MSPSAASKVAYGNDEPKWGDNPPSPSQLVLAYSYYHDKYSHDEALEFLRQHLSKKDDIETLEKFDVCDQRFIPATICFLSRMLDNGMVPLEESKIYYEKKINEIRQAPAKIVHIKAAATKNKHEELIIDIVAKIDAFLDENDLISIQDLVFLSKHDLEVYQKVYLHYNDITKQLYDEELKSEFFGNKTEAEIEDIKSIYLSVMAVLLKRINTNQRQEPTEKEEKPKEHKVESPEKNSKYVVYLKKDTVLNLESISPAKVVGAKELWIWNNKTRILTAFVAQDEKGLYWYRSGLENVGRSYSKKVRKPHLIVPKVLDQGIKVSWKMLQDIKGVELSVNNRTNKNTVLLKVVK